MSTPHINAEKGDFAETVLMPGDPYRAEFIAKNFLDNARLVNDVRAVKGYTAPIRESLFRLWQAEWVCPLSGYIPMSFLPFRVENIIRIGSAGSYSRKCEINGYCYSAGACTDSNYAGRSVCPAHSPPQPISEYCVKRLKPPRKWGFATMWAIYYQATDFIRTPSLPASMRPPECWAKMGVLCVEMEAAALFMNAAAAGKHAAAVFTISDSLITGEKTTAEERQNSFTDMMKLALETTLLL